MKNLITGILLFYLGFDSGVNTALLVDINDYYVPTILKTVVPVIIGIILIWRSTIKGLEHG